MRFVLIDYLHLAYKCYALPPLSCIVNIDGVDQVVDTVIPTHTCKDVWRFSGAGRHYTGVFLEGGAFVRKAYFDAVNAYKTEYLARKTGKAIVASDVDDSYKAGRKGLGTSQKLGVQLAQDRLLAGDISCYQVTGYEADDLIWTAVSQLRHDYPDAYIDVFTGDMDMLPMVDDHVSVYMRGNRTFAEPMCHDCNCTDKYEVCEKFNSETCKFKREFSGYFQVTPRTWDDFIYYRSAFKGCAIPYNAIFFYKMLRGDVSDNVPMAEKGWGKKKLEDLFAKMQADGVDFSKDFRYDTPWSHMYEILIKYFSPETVAFMGLNAEGLRPRNDMSVLVNYMPLMGSNEQIDVKTVYSTISSQQTFYPKTEGEQKRAILVANAANQGIAFGDPIRLRMPMQPDLGKFQVSLSQLKINLPVLKTAL